MDRLTRVVLIIALSATFLVTAAMLYDNYRMDTEGDIIYIEAAEELISIRLPEQTNAAAPATTGAAGTEPAGTTTVPESEAAVQTTAAAQTRPIITDAEAVEVDFERLQAINSEAVGWIVIENTTVSYPIMQGGDNEKYLKTTYNNKYSKYGSIFIDYRIKGDFSARHTVIYGHNMRNSAMFGTLLRFTEQSYWKNRKYFHILTPDGGVLKYEIFSAYKSDIGSETYTVSFRDSEHYSEVLAKMIEWSDIDTGVVPDATDKIVTLCTCTSSNDERDTKRNVVHGRLISDSRIETEAE